MPVGSGAVFILAQDFNLDKLMPRLEKYEGRARVIQTSLSDADEARLREALAGTGGRMPQSAEGVARGTSSDGATAAVSGGS